MAQVEMKKTTLLTTRIRFFDFCFSGNTIRLHFLLRSLILLDGIAGGETERAIKAS